MESTNEGQNFYLRVGDKAFACVGNFTVTVREPVYTYRCDCCGWEGTDGQRVDKIYDDKYSTHPTCPVCEESYFIHLEDGKPIEMAKQPAPAKTDKTVKTSVAACARCGQDHANLTFEPLDNPTDGYGYFAMCPTTQQPILMRAQRSEDAPKKEKNRHATEKEGVKYRDVTENEFNVFVSNYQGVLMAARVATSEPPVKIYYDPTKGSRNVAKIVFNELMEGHPDYMDKKNEYRIYE